VNDAHERPSHETGPDCELYHPTPPNNVVELVQTAARKETHPKFWDHPCRSKWEIIDRERGIVEEYPKRKKVAIVGFADSSRNAAPFDDPEWTVWSLNQLYRHIPRFDRWFEIHSRPIFVADIVRDTHYVEWLQTAPVPVYMMQTFPDMPMSVRYPIEQVGALQGIPVAQTRAWYEGLALPSATRGGGPYLQSAIGFMIALAILEGFEEIGLWGIDLVVGGEYEYQKPNAEFWLGYAMARGIKVTIPKTSALLRQLYVYGYEVEPPYWPFRLSDFGASTALYQKQRDDVEAEVYKLDGAILEAEALRKHLVSLPEDRQATLAGMGMGPEQIGNRIAAQVGRREKLYDQMRALDGAVLANHQWAEMMQMVQRGVTVSTAWGRVIAAPGTFGEASS
jgi:hypothetical protein